MKPRIDSTEFGSITIAGKRIEHDVLIRLSGEVAKRKKRLSKDMYGTSHMVSLAEAEYICDAPKGSETFVLSKKQIDSDPFEVGGFYSLAISGIRKENLAAKHLSRLPNFPLPVARLARLAVETRHQRQGLGDFLLADALQRCLRLSVEIGMIGVIVDAKDEHARGWYERYEFQRLPDSQLTLSLPTAAIARL